MTGTGRPCVNVAPSSNPVSEIVGATVSIRNAFDCTAEVLPLKSTAIHFSVALVRDRDGSGFSRGRFGFHSVEAVVGVEPSSV